MSMKEDARVLRECADRIEALDGFAQHVEELRESANAIDPRIDRPEIGKWFIFRDSGDSFTDWPWFATHDGVKSHSYYGSPMLYTWLEFDEKVTVEGWTVEPFRQGYTIDEIEAVLNEIFDDEWFKNPDGKMLWPGIGHVTSRLRRLRGES